MRLIAIYNHRLLSVFLFVLGYLTASGQQNQDSVLHEATLDKVVEYATTHQPAYHQSQIDRNITEKMIKGKIADWYPQVNFTYNYQRNFILQQSVIGGNVIKFGVDNLSAAQVSATQNIFNRDVVLASRTASMVRAQSDENVVRSRLDLEVNVTKAFYGVLATLQEIEVGQEDIIRLKKSLKDAQSRYTSGVSDKTDFKRAQILLKNSEALLKSNQETLKYRYQLLKGQIGYPLESELNISYDTLQMENEIDLDTTAVVDYNANIDYRILVVNRELQSANVKYNQWAYIPTVSLFGAYFMNFQNNVFTELYNNIYPYSYAGATLTVPIFQGTKRSQKVQEQKWTLKRMDWDLVRMQNTINTEYARSMASYKSNLSTYMALRDNVQLAREVYDIIQLQYKNGVKAYIDVIVAETDLRSARINYFNALYDLLSSKMDVYRALGQTKN